MPDEKSAAQEINASIKLRMPCEIVTEHLLPLIRSELAQELVNRRGVSQLQAAKLLGVTQPAVSNYVHSQPKVRRELQGAVGDIEGLAGELADALLGGRLTQSDALGGVCSLCIRMRNRGPICEIHAEEVKGLEADQCSLCLGDLARFREMSMEDRDAVEAVRQALRVVEGSRDLTALIPEIGMNITYAKPGAVDAEGVVGVPGRIRPIAAHPRSAHTPEFGGSSHVARAVLAMMGFHPGLRSAMSLRFDWRVVDICGRLGLPVSHFDRAEEPPEVKAVDGRTIQWGVGQAVRSSAEPPRVIYDVGDVGKEPLIFLFGQNPMEVAQLAVRIAKEYAGSKKSTVN